MSERGAKKRKPRGLRPDGRVQVTYTDGRRPDGRPNRIPFYGRTRAEAEAKRQEYIDEKKAGLSWVDRKLTVGEWVDRWIDLYSIDETEYRPYINRLRDDLGGLELRGIREGHLVRSLSAYSGKSKSGASKYRMVLKQVFHRAYKNRLIVDDPAEDLELPDGVTEGSHRALERWEVEHIVAHWRDYPAGRWAMLMMFAGLRRGEMIALDWSCVDMAARTISVVAAVSFKGRERRVKDTKTEAGLRILPISGPLFDMLSETPEAQRVGPVCLSASGRPITEDTARKNWAAYCSAMTYVLNGFKPLQAGSKKTVEDLSGRRVPVSEVEKLALAGAWRVFDCDMHDLRHTFATMLFESGIEPKDAQYYLGHADLRMTLGLYTHLTAERKKKTLSMLTGFLDKWLSGETAALPPAPPVPSVSAASITSMAEMNEKTAGAWSERWSGE